MSIRIHHCGAFVGVVLVAIVADLFFSHTLPNSVKVHNVDVPVENWEGVHKFSPKHIHAPGSEDEVISILREAAGKGEKVKAVGAGHSWSNAAQPVDHLLCTKKLNKVLWINTTAQVAEVEAGIQLQTLADALRAFGFAFELLPSISEQTLAGAVATGTHGSGRRWGNLASQVLAVRFVTAAGEVIQVNAESDRDLFDAIRVSLGALGILTTVTIRIVPAYNVHVKQQMIPLDAFLSNWESIIGSNDFVKLWWLPHANVVNLFTMNRVMNESGSLPHYMLRKAQSRLVYGLQQVGAHLTFMAEPINRFMAQIYPYLVKEQILRSDEAHVIPEPVALHSEMEFSVDIDFTPRIIQDVAQMIAEKNLHINHIIEVRFVKADDIWLSPNFNRTTCHVELLLTNPSQYLLNQYYSGFERLVQPYHGRPHWAKTFYTNAERFADLYPRYKDFVALRDKLDPNKMFWNPFLDQIFGSSSDPQVSAS